MPLNAIRAGMLERRNYCWLVAPLMVPGTILAPVWLEYTHYPPGSEANSFFDAFIAEDVPHTLIVGLPQRHKRRASAALAAACLRSFPADQSGLLPSVRVYRAKPANHHPLYRHGEKIVLKATLRERQLVAEIIYRKWRPTASELRSAWLALLSDKA